MNKVQIESGWKTVLGPLRLNTNEKVLIEVYECVVPNIKYHETPPGILKRIDTEEMSLVVMKGMINYENIQLELNYNGNSPIRFYPKKTVHETPLGIYTIIIIPLDTKNDIRNDSQLDYVKGLVNAVEGRNILYKYVCKFGLSIPSFMPALTSNSILMPNLTNDPLKDGERLVNILNCINGLQEKETNIIKLGLRWYDQADRGLPIDSFLKMWFALETISLPRGTTNISIIKKQLAKIYKTKYSEDLYRLGKIYKIRGDIVHSGLMIPIQSRLVEYLQAIFYDILLSKLKLTSERKTEKMINQYPVDSWLV